MGPSLEAEKIDSVHNDHVDESVTTPTWLATVTNFVAHWGVETNGYVFAPDTVVGGFSGC